jgi:hypothetical protein
MKSELASVPHESSVCYLLFPISEIHRPQSALFHPRRLLGACRNRNFDDPGMFPAADAAEQQLPALLIRITGGPLEERFRTEWPTQSDRSCGRS